MRIPKRSKLEEEYRRRVAKYDATARRLVRQLQQLVHRRGINASITDRVKSFES